MQEVFRDGESVVLQFTLLYILNNFYVIYYMYVANTVQPLLSGHPPLSGHFPKVPIYLFILYLISIKQPLFKVLRVAT